MVMDRPGLSGRLAASSLRPSPAVCEAPGSLVAVTLTGSGLLMGPLSARAGCVARRWGGLRFLGSAVAWTAWLGPFILGWGWSPTIEASQEVSHWLPYLARAVPGT